MLPRFYELVKLKSIWIFFTYFIYFKALLLQKLYLGINK